MTVPFHDLTDSDLDGLLGWCEPLARMEARVLAVWANRAWHAAREEQVRRLDGGTGRPWPVRVSATGEDSPGADERKLTALH